MNFKNMKIAITEDQSLDQVECELERIGYWWTAEDEHNKSLSVLCFEDGYCSFRVVDQLKYTTTLAELKEM